MSHLIHVSLIVAAAATAPSGHRADTVAHVFRCGFDADWDKNYDNWPDGWTRQTGPRYPHYLTVQLQNHASEDAPNRHLQADLNGGAVLVESPALRIDPRLAFAFSGLLKTTGLKHDRAFLLVTFFDADGAAVASSRSAAVTGTTAWQTLRVGTLWPPSSARHAKLALYVEPGEQGDLNGSVMVDDLELKPVVRIDLKTGRRLNIFHAADDVEIECQVSGISGGETRVAVQLENAVGDRLAQVELPIVDEGESVLDAGRRPSAGETDNDQQATAEDRQPLSTGHVTWKPALETGFYRVRARIVGASGSESDRDTTIAVIDREKQLARSEFGWSLPDGEAVLTLEELPDLLSLAGVGWIKYPLWFDADATAEDEKLSQFADNLQARRIQLIGLLSNPPEAVRQQVPATGQLTAAHVFSTDASIWYPSLETTMTRMGMNTRWWQLGRDGDTSFVEYPQLPERLDAVRTQLANAVPDVQIGIGWSWLDPAPAEVLPAWRFLSMSSDPPLSAQELIAYLDGEAARGVQRWVELTPLPEGHYDEKTRAVDLVQRMMAAKMHGAQAIFIPAPFDAKRGLIRDDATPGSLLLPWRTTARALAGATHAGSIQLPEDGENDVFLREDEAIFVFRGDRPGRQQVYLGPGARQVDIWGHSRPLDDASDGQFIEIGDLPTFVIGASAALVRWRQAVEFQQPRLPHEFRVPHSNALTLANPFDEGILGSARLVLPEGWTSSPGQIDIQLGPGERVSEPLEIVLPLNADSGKQPVRIDFDIQADRQYRFSVHRQLEVGLGEIELEVVSRLNAAGELEVQQRLVNKTAQPIAFRCHLFAPRRLRQSKLVECRARGEATADYVFPNGDELVGQSLWIRAEEISGSRVLNRRFNAGR